MSLAATLVLSLFLTILGHGKVIGDVDAQEAVTADVTATPTPSVTPTDIPTITPTVTPDVTPTDTPTVTPTVSVTPTASPTPTVQPSVTPTVTPVASVTPTPTGDGDKDDMLGIKSDVHSLFGLMNAAFHHEQNENRFEQKHGVDKDGK